MQLVEGLGLVRWYKNLRRSARFWWRLNHRWWWIIRRSIPYGCIQESRCPYLLWTWTGSFSGLLCLCDMLQSWFALFFLILMWSRIWSSWQFRIWSRSCSWWRCSLRRIGNFFRWSYNCSCCLSSQSCWFVCFVKPGDVCLCFHRGENGFGHACTWLSNTDEFTCLRVWNVSFYFYWLNCSLM